MHKMSMIYAQKLKNIKSVKKVQKNTHSFVKNPCQGFLVSL